MSEPTSHTHLIPVRYQDCDAYGIVNAVNYLHFLLEATMAHNVRHGYTFETWMRRGIAWVIRDTEIEFIRPLRYGDKVNVSVQVSELRRVSAVRTYELSVEGSAGLAARARSEFAVVSLETQRPVPLPEDMIQAYFPEGIPAKLPPRKRFPKAPPPPSKLFRWRTGVEWRDLDAQRHVSNATYLSYMQMAVLEQNEKMGWPVQRMMAQHMAGVTRWIHILYQGQALIGDEIEVTSYFSNMGTSSCTRHDIIRRVADDAPLARGHTHWVWIDLDTLRPVEIPAAFAAALDGYVVDTAGTSNTMAGT